MSILESNLTAQDKKGIVEEGHKIKGAAGSVGLRHLQQLGQQIQSPDLPAWEDNVGEWIEEPFDQFITSGKTVFATFFLASGIPTSTTTL